jgi:hypothetical protein
LERIFRERFGVVITRQQMVQWVEKVAHLLLAIYWLIWEGLKAGNYLQVDESPVKVVGGGAKVAQNRRFENPVVAARKFRLGGAKLHWFSRSFIR